MPGLRELWTIGHWTCPEPVFLKPLRAHDIAVLVDVRAQPGSRRNPQFGRDAMQSWLPKAGIDYVHLPELAGRRPRQGVDPSVNAGWRNESFHRYADYTLSEEYQTGITRLIDLAGHRRTVIMCGEPMPWRCHRLLISNTLTAVGWTLWHLMVGSEPRGHELGQWGARPYLSRDGALTYPADTVKDRFQMG